ncbi:MAG: amidohydrolase [Coriobacteriaceae bacterium]|jgi:predicted amidohydrolase YtcJ|nr:amidohydrolase [Coriobacteriaceae bacterium]
MDAELILISDNLFAGLRAQTLQSASFALDAQGEAPIQQGVAAAFLGQKAPAWPSAGEATGGRHRSEPGLQQQGACRIALAIAQGRVIGICPADKAFRFQGPHTRVRDFGKALMMPGFHDAHLHVFHSALYRSPLALSYRGKSEQDYVAALAPLAARRPQGSWLLAQGWREYRWDPPLLPSKASLDAVYPNRPVALYSGDAHTLWLNSCALCELGINNISASAQEGFDRDSQGELTGIVREGAAMALMPRILATISNDELASVYTSFFKDLVSKGVTSLCDMALTPHQGLDFIRDDLYDHLLAQGSLPLRAHLFPTLTDDLSRFEAMRRRFAGMQSDGQGAEPGNERVQVPGLKQFFDGVSSQHTAYLGKPYTNARFPGERGKLTLPSATMRKLVMGAAQRGYAVRIHTIGDGAIHEALDIFEEALARFGAPQGQHCLEHLENIQQDDIDRLARLDVLASVQPAHMTLDPGGPERDLGHARLPDMWPLRTFMDRGVKLAFGTDSPVVGIDPLENLYTAVTRQDAGTHWPKGGWQPQERINLAEALDACTRGGAQAVGRSHELGSLAPGMLADITLLDLDPFTGDPQALLEARVLATFVGGECVFRQVFFPKRA